MVGGEIQLYGTGNEAALAASAVFSAHGADVPGWYAIHAVTGAFITPTHTGNTTTADYVATTQQRAGGDKTTGLADNEFYHPAWGGTFVQPQNTLPEAVKNLLELYGVWPSLTGKAIVPAGSTVNYNAGATSCMHPVRGKNDIFQFGFANNIEVLNSRWVCARCITRP